MKLLAPCSDPAEVEPLLRAGADELYCGLFDGDWLRRWGPASWPNRRGPGPANLPSRDALEQVVSTAHEGGAAVQLTLNATLLSPEQEEAALAVAGDALALGVDGIVVAAPQLLVGLRRHHAGVTLVASSLCSARNVPAVRLLAELGADRVILPRQLTLAEIGTIRRGCPDTAIEAFVLNDACAFDEGCCSTAHQLPGWDGAYCLESFRPIEDDGRPEPAVARHRAWLDALGTRGFTASGGLPLGPCGLCALPQLAGDGVDGVKVVGREAHPYRKVRSVQMVRHVLDALRDGGPERARRRARALREDPDGCRGGLHCYYPEARSADE